MRKVKLATFSDKTMKPLGFLRDTDIVKVNYDDFHKGTIITFMRLEENIGFHLGFLGEQADAMRFGIGPILDGFWRDLERGLKNR